MKYTFDDLTKLDIFTRAEIIHIMTDEDRRYALSTAPSLDSIKANKNLREAMKRTPEDTNCMEQDPIELSTDELIQLASNQIIEMINDTDSFTDDHYLLAHYTLWPYN